MIRTALCSFGSSGKYFHAPFIEYHKGFQLYAVVERSRKEAVLTYPHIRSFDSVEEMLADEAIDLVIVNTPNHTHYDFARQALEASKHVLVEKSFTIHANEAEELNRLAIEKGKVLCVYQNRRYDSDFRTVQKVIESGALGKIVEAEIHFDRYNLQLSPKQHKETNNPGAGLLHDLGPHIIDQAICLFGMPDYVFATLRKVRPATVIYDFFDIQLMYPQLSVRLKASLVNREQVPAYVIHGLDGSFVKLRGDVQEDDLKRGRTLSDPDWGAEPPGWEGILHTAEGSNSIPTIHGDYRILFEELFQAIRHNAPVPVPAEQGIWVMQIIDAALASFAAGKKISPVIHGKGTGI